MVCSTVAIPLPIRECETIVERTTGIAQLGRREETIDRDRWFEVPESFVFQLSPELTHRGIGEALGQLGSRKALHGQILDAYPVVVLNQLGGQLMEKVAPLVGGFSVDTSKLDSSLCFPLRPTLSPGNGLLSLAKSSLSLAIELGGWDWVGTVAQRGKVDQSEIDAHNLRGVRRGRNDLRQLELDNEAYMPLTAGVLPEGCALGCPVNVSALPDTHPADLGDIDLAAGSLDSLGNAETERVSFAALEPRVSSPTLKEIRERPVEIGKSLLKHLSVGFLEPCRFRLTFERGQLSGELFQTDRLPGRSMGFFPSGKPPIPDPSPCPRLAKQERFLRLSGTHAESINLPESSHALDQLLILDVPLDDRQRRTTDSRDEIGVRPEGGKPASESRELLSQKSRRSPFSQLDESVDTELWIDFHQDVDMVGHNLYFKKIGARLGCNLTDNLLESSVYTTHEHRSPKLGAPHDVVFAGIDDASVALVLHALIIQVSAIESRISR